MSLVLRAILAGLFAILTGAASAQSPGTFTSGQTLSATQLNNTFATKKDYQPGGSGAGGLFYAIEFGVVADGTTSDDVAAKAAIDACSAAGGTVYFPAGRIRITGNTSISPNNCQIIGMGSQGTIGLNKGTYWIIDSPLTGGSVSLFVNPYRTTFAHMGFFWPQQGQDGSTMVAYPALFHFVSNPFGAGCACVFDDVSVLNAYDVIHTELHAMQFSDTLVINSHWWAGHQIFGIRTIAETTKVSNTQFDPGRFFQYTNAFATGSGYRDWGTLSSNSVAIWHILDQAGDTAVDGLEVDSNTVTCGARYGIHIESGGILSGNSQILQQWDCTRTILQVEPGGCIQGTKLGHAKMGTYRPTWTVGDTLETHDTSFLINATVGVCVNTLIIADAGITSRGNIISGQNFNMELDNNSFALIAPDQPYTYIGATGGNTSFQWRIRNNKFLYEGADNRGIGVVVPANYIGMFIFQNNFGHGFTGWINLNGYNFFAMIDGNFSQVDQGGIAAFRANTTTGDIFYGMGNRFELPPIPVLTGCGTSPTIAGSVISGYILLGSGTVTTCSMDFGWKAYRIGWWTCLFNNINGVALTINNVTNHDQNFTSVGAVNMATQFVYYICPTVR